MGLEDTFHNFDFLSFISMVLPKYTKIKSLRDRAYLRTMHCFLKFIKFLIFSRQGVTWAPGLTGVTGLGFRGLILLTVENGLPTD